MSTTAKSKGSSAKVKRGFAKETTRRAAELAGRYAYVVRFEAEDECYVGHSVELPHQIGAGNTPEAALREARELTATTLAAMIEDGHEPSPPGADGPRTEQVNFRVSAEEKARLEAAARRHGLSLVDYIRGSALKAGQTSSK